jgi:seryl-tRNA synthetase
MATGGKFDPDKLRELDLFGHDEPQEPDPIESADKLLRHLREWHRELSEQIVSVNREMGHVAAGGNLNSPEVLALREQAQQLRDKRAEVEAEIEAETKQLKALLARQKQGEAAQPATSEANDKAGLIRVRHPNRDFFLADLFDYALKDDGASMEAPIFTLSTKPDLSIWQWTSKDGNKSVKVAPSVLGRATQHDKDVLIYVVSQLTRR